MPAVCALFVLLILAPSASASAHKLTGAWRSAPEETPLGSAFDESVWGKHAKSVRTVEMMVRPMGDATLTVTHKIIDAHGRAVKEATSIEHVELSLGDIEHTSNEARADYAVTIKHAERRYPGDPASTWPLDGLKVTVSTLAGEPASLEVRVDTPEGRGSFWETLRRSKP
jgi:hypothetical protein